MPEQAQSKKEVEATLFNGKPAIEVTLKLSTEVHEKLARKANSMGRELGAFVDDLIAAQLGLNGKQMRPGEERLENYPRPGTEGY